MQNEVMDKATMVDLELEIAELEAEVKLLSIQRTRKLMRLEALKAKKGQEKKNQRVKLNSGSEHNVKECDDDWYTPTGLLDAIDKAIHVGDLATINTPSKSGPFRHIKEAKVVGRTSDGKGKRIVLHDLEDPTLTTYRSPGDITIKRDEWEQDSD